ncbi:cellulose biosynthesis protein BcsS [Bosea sp. F3-2]|uniref:cellulose biosynthesis protein BcsS n=1 Tax=Bosea sp. F3-2 TaxID=2599640 RepID=UPI0011EBF42D|nr:cellulose biosynthesis protein BcsS [Bosea sp. F3-2]QEL21209.1 cellulose biosynthesis protein BcsS [Bosea sp. F3-2]
MAYGWSKAKLTGLALFATAAPLDLPRAEEESDERSPISMVIFSSLEAGPTKTFVSVGMKRALGSGLAESGFRLFLKAGGSQEQTRRQPPHGTTYKAESQAMLGYEWRVGDSFLALYAGSDFESEQRIETFGPSMITKRYGARLQADLWAVPADRMMLQANAYVSSVDHRLWGRVAPGWQMPMGFYVGPEVEAYRERNYRKLRLGLHLTGLRFLGLEWRLSGGWQRTSDQPSEAYGTLGLHWLG